MGQLLTDLAWVLKNSDMKYLLVDILPVFLDCDCPTVVCMAGMIAKRYRLPRNIRTEYQIELLFLVPILGRFIHFPKIRIQFSISKLLDEQTNT